MFNFVGGKIKGIARALYVIGILFSFAGGFAVYYFKLLPDLFKGSDIVFGVAVLVLGVLISWISNCILFGLGELIENSVDIKQYASTCAGNTRALLEKNKASDDKK